MNKVPFQTLYGTTDTTRLSHLLEQHHTTFGTTTPVRVFSAPGRVELCGNHTDHQGGSVVAMAVNLDILAVVTPRQDNRITFVSTGHRPCKVDLSGPCPQGGSPAMVWGVAKALQNKGFRVGGFDCVTHSYVPTGSGLSSSAAFENLVATIFDHLYNKGTFSPLTKALAGQWSENTCYHKPCGLMDQLASCLGGVAYMDFSAKPTAYQQLDFPMDRVLCVVQTGGSHNKLTHLYAAIPEEMKQVANFFGKPVLSRVTKEQVLEHIVPLREVVGDRGILRAIHFFDETLRCRQVKTALLHGDTNRVLSLVEASGYSSRCLLQNVSNPETPREDGMGLALTLSRQLSPGGVVRVHGGGFGGTVLGLIPSEEFAAYQAGMEQVFGKGSVTRLTVRPYGGVEVI